MIEILIIGEINLDIFIFLENNKSHTKNYSTKIGGTAYNIAKSLKNLKINPIIFSYIGEDFIGKGIYNELSKYFNLDLIQKVNSTNIILYFIKEDKFDVVGLRKQDLIFKVNENFLKLYNDIKIVHISPYIFMNNENFKFFNEIKRENKIFLTNLSIPILDNQRFLKILNKFDYIFMNLEEAKKLTKKENLEEIKKFLKKNFINSIITLMDGVYFLNKEEEVFLETEEINKKINIGAGDYLIGGFISGLYRNLRIEDCLKFGIESVKNYLNFIK